MPMTPLPKRIKGPALLDLNGDRFLLAMQDGVLKSWLLIGSVWELQGEVPDTSYYQMMPKLQAVA